MSAMSNKKIMSPTKMISNARTFLVQNCMRLFKRILCGACASLTLEFRLVFHLMTECHQKFFETSPKSPKEFHKKCDVVWKSFMCKTNVSNEQNKISKAQKSHIPIFSMISVFKLAVFFCLFGPSNSPKITSGEEKIQFKVHATRYH